MDGIRRHENAPQSPGHNIVSLRPYQRKAARRRRRAWWAAFFGFELDSLARPKSVLAVSPGELVRFGRYRVAR